MSTIVTRNEATDILTALHADGREQAELGYAHDASIIYDAAEALTAAISDADDDEVELNDEIAMYAENAGLLA